MMTVMQIHVIGNEKMHCAGCETREICTAPQQISVTIDPSAVSREPMCARLQPLGYEVTL